MPDGARIQIVGLIPDGKNSLNLADDPLPAMFFPILQSPSSDAYLVVRSDRELSQLSTAIRAKLHELDPGLPSYIETWTTAMQGALFAPRMASLTLGVLGAMGAILGGILINSVLSGGMFGGGGGGGGGFGGGGGGRGGGGGGFSSGSFGARP